MRSVGPAGLLHKTVAKAVLWALWEDLLMADINTFSYSKGVSMDRAVTPLTL